MLTDSARLDEFAAVFDSPAKKDGPPTRLHFHVAQIPQGVLGVRRRVEVPGCDEDGSAWTVGDFSYCDH
ncbi:hypothetical protein [Streptomyces sp. NPDC058678]|uniref:hypothetical protein n=1 Tax=Streptomyces sp. NPDC058678 TaxID=3346595 RepID=UPI00364E59AA